MHDAILAERAGIKATAIITDRFEETARIMAEVSGKPGFSFALTPHPISDNSDDMIRNKAEDALNQCIKILLKR